MQNLCHSIVVGIGTERFILYDMRSKQIYVGLLDKIVSFVQELRIHLKFEDNKFYGTPFEENDFRFI